MTRDSPASLWLTLQSQLSLHDSSDRIIALVTINC